MLPRKLSTWITHIGRYAGRPWYPFLLAALSAVDLFVLVIPAEGIMVASTFALPRRWFLIALGTTTGSALGAMALAAVLLAHGGSAIEWFSPGIHGTSSWKFAEQWMNQYGVWALLGLSATPMLVVPLVVLASLSGLPVMEVGAAVFAGRMARNSLYTYLASHAPRVLLRFKSINKEVGAVTQDVAPPRDESRAKS
jgi:membrane protein YqaA with SNARE-associated domain